MAENNGNGEVAYNGTAIRQMNGDVCLVEIDTQGHVLRSSGVACVWSGTSRFHDWFVGRYGPLTIILDGGAAYAERVRVRAKLPCP